MRSYRLTERKEFLSVFRQPTESKFLRVGFVLFLYLLTLGGVDVLFYKTPLICHYHVLGVGEFHQKVLFEWWIGS